MKALALAAALLAAAGCASPPPERDVAVSDGRYAMGTVLELTLHGDDREALAETLDALFATAAELDALLTVYEPDSAISRLNRAAGAGPQPADATVREVLGLAVDYAELTGGGFDVTVGPLVEVWVEAARSGVLPSDSALAEARARVGSDKLRVQGGRVELARPGMAVDLGGIAKGYALDRMLPRLRRDGVESALLVFGQSSTWAVGAPPGEAGWRLLARGPDDAFLGVLTLRDQALSVSGTLGQFVEIEGRRYGHVLDPRSGQPLTRRRQALVVAPRAALAEALSKGLLVLGPEEGLALVAAQPGCAGLLADAGGGVWTTPNWDEAVRFEPTGTSQASASAIRSTPHGDPRPVVPGV